MELKPTWQPSKKIIEQSNIYKMMQQVGSDTYQNFWKWSISHKEDFWEATIKNLGIQLQKKYGEIVNTKKGVENAQWLKNATLNIVDSCFQNNEDATAIVFQKEEEETLQTISQKELLFLVNRIANGLVNLGLKKGDKIAIDLPMTVEAVAIYLAGIKAGMPIVTIADSFTPNEIAVRLTITQPKVLFTQNVLQRAGKKLPLYQKVIEANAPKTVVINENSEELFLRKNDLNWDNFLSSKATFKTVLQQPDDIITILFSSGTTGAPKAIPWTHTTPIKSASDGYYHHNIQKNDVVCWPTNLGWMMGPWLVFASLINKATIALYYGAPSNNNFGKFIQKANVTMLGVIPSFVKTWKQNKCMESLDWSSIKCFSSTGEVSNPTEMQYLMKLAGNKPVIEYCGGTEIGGGYVTSTVVQPNIASTFSTQALGGAFVLLNGSGKESTQGEVFLIPPIMGLSTTLLNKNHFNEYYKNTPVFNNILLRRHGDELMQLKNGYYKAMGRIDDAMNLGGIKISSVQIEAVLNQLDFIKETAAIAVAPKNGGPSQLVVYYVENETTLTDSEEFEIAKNYLKKQLNPLFKLEGFIKINLLPRTASNKVMRRKLRDMYMSEN